VEKTCRACWYHKIDTPRRAGDPPCTRGNLTAPCYYSAKVAICKYPKPTIFERNFRDNRHTTKFIAKNRGFFGEIADFTKNAEKYCEKKIEKRA
jgi:hypothetical protein